MALIPQTGETEKRGLKACARRSWLAAVLAGLGALCGLAAELPPLDIPACAKPPALDGNIDDPAWQPAVKIAQLYRLNSATPAPETTLWLMHDKAWLYLAAHCRNPHLPQARQSAQEHDGLPNKDDSLEIFIRPSSGADDPYYHFMLNFANVGTEQRCTRQGTREIGWNPPWRTATQRQADGWTAEIAIPLFVLGTNDLSGMQINLCRNLAAIELDGNGVKTNETRIWHTLRPGSAGSFHEFANFRAAGGLGGFKPEAALFAPQIVAASVTGVREDADKKFYDLKVVLDLGTPVAGAAQLKVVEDFGAGAVEALAQPVDLKGRMELELKIPAGDLRARKVKIVLSNPADNRLLAERALGQIDLVKGVILKNKQPFYQEGAAPKVRTAALVVAAADALTQLKSQADFICDGLDDHVVINAAIAALPATGGSVHLTAGTFSIGGVPGTYGGISILRSNVLLTGEGSGTRLILQDGLTDINVIWIHGNLSDVTVRDLFINGNGKNQTPWVRARSGWQGGNGIKAIDRGALGPTPRNVRVENCHIENCQLMAVMLSGAAAEVRNCYFTGNFGSHVIELLGDSGRIESCTLQVKDGDSAGFGFATDACYNYQIINNKIIIDAGGTIRSHPINNWPPKLYGGGSTSNHLYHGTIAGNIVINNGKAGGIRIDGYMDMVNNNIFRGVPVVIGCPYGGIGVMFEHNMLINGALEINSPHRGDDCLIFIDGNAFFNSTVTHKEGTVVWGTNPGYVPGKQPLPAVNP